MSSGLRIRSAVCPTVAPTHLRRRLPKSHVHLGGLGIQSTIAACRIIPLPHLRPSANLDGIGQWRSGAVNPITSHLPLPPSRPTAPNVAWTSLAASNSARLVFVLAPFLASLVSLETMSASTPRQSSSPAVDAPLSERDRIAPLSRVHGTLVASTDTAQSTLVLVASVAPTMAKAASSSKLNHPSLLLTAIRDALSTNSYRLLQATHNWTFSCSLTYLSLITVRTW
jgi:hypothetical protein